jgi:hypothetical protein
VVAAAVAMRPTSFRAGRGHALELRRIADSNAAIEKGLEQIERGMGAHDEQSEQVFGALRQLIAPPLQPKRPVGFRVPEDDEKSKPRSTA